MSGDAVKLDPLDEDILRIMQDDIPLVSRPFLVVAERLGVTEQEVMDRVRRMIKAGVVRRFSASIRHRKLGIKANPMIVWKVPDERVEEVGRLFSEFDEVTHCYERAIAPGKWEYNLYTMIHGYDTESVERLAKKLARTAGIKDYMMLYSIKEYKKTYKRYE
jgi:DNA-binding Lrp family transcriptional regulator